MSKHLEKEVRGFVGWCRAFLGRVEGTNGVTMHWEWEEQLCPTGRGSVSIVGGLDKGVQHLL